MTDPLTIARRFARRLGYGPISVRVVFDKRRRFGCALLKRIEPGRGRRAETVVAVPAHWQEVEPQCIDFKPLIEVTKSLPSKSEWRRLRRYTRLIRFNGHRASFRIAYKRDPGNVAMEAIERMLRAGTLRLDLSNVKRPGETDRELQTLISRVS